MRIAIVGAGLLGVASAYYLAKEGHEVLVVDRQSAPARSRRTDGARTSYFHRFAGDDRSKWPLDLPVTRPEAHR